jgi:hypothetical protein
MLRGFPGPDISLFSKTCRSLRSRSCWLSAESPHFLDSIQRGLIVEVMTWMSEIEGTGEQTFGELDKTIVPFNICGSERVVYPESSHKPQVGQSSLFKRQVLQECLALLDISKRLRPTTTSGCWCGRGAMYNKRSKSEKCRKYDLEKHVEVVFLELLTQKQLKVFL